MLPFTFSDWLNVVITLDIGFLFGFVLERAGFGNARNLAAQFYLHDMRVLKVMFTAIVTAMSLIYAASAIGLVDFGRVWVPPTYLGSAALGGFILGVGFIIAGYCPGTSLVAMATFKVDALFCVAGVLGGLWLFGETAPSYWSFFQQGGSLGRLTLPELFGVDAGVMVLGVVLMAVGAFFAAEKAEKFFSSADAKPLPPSHRAICWRRAAVFGAIVLGAATLLRGQPTTPRKVQWAEQRLSATLSTRSVHIDAGELLGLMHNHQAQTVLLDVRPAADYRLFHLLDARHVALEDIDGRYAARIPAEAVVVVMSNDEGRAEEAWKRLAVELNGPAVGGRNRVYVLAGGVNRWLDIYQQRQATAPDAQTPSPAGDLPRYVFDAALGSRHPAARPAIKTAIARQFTPKVQFAKPVKQAGGGCG